MSKLGEDWESKIRFSMIKFKKPFTQAQRNKAQEAIASVINKKPLEFLYEEDLAASAAVDSVAAADRVETGAPARKRQRTVGDGSRLK